MNRHRGAGRSGASKLPQSTHFLCLPLNNTVSRAELDAAFVEFHKGVAEKIPAKAIRPVGTLHLTLGMMSLSPRGLETAVITLQTLNVPDMLREDDGARQQHAQRGEDEVKPLQIRLRGLESMHKPQNTSILYIAPEDPTGRLRLFSSLVQAVFREKSLLVPDNRPLKLHTTVANTIYAKSSMLQKGSPKQGQSLQDTSDRHEAVPAVIDSSERVLHGSTGHRSNGKASLRIDAREILESYKDFTWAERITLDRIAICEMGAKKTYDEAGQLIGEEYKVVVHISLPT